MSAALVAGLATASAQQCCTDSTAAKPRFTIGGYGEAVMSRNFYSQHFNRYRDPATYKDDDSHGRFDLPHVTLNLGYDFGKGWTMGMEIEFEHGGTENAVESMLMKVVNTRLRQSVVVRLPLSSSGLTKLSGVASSISRLVKSSFLLARSMPITCQTTFSLFTVQRAKPKSFLTPGTRWVFPCGVS